MLNTVEEFLDFLARKPADYQLQSAEWLTVNRLFTLSTSAERNALLQGLAQHTKLDIKEIKAFLISPTSLQLFAQKQLTAQQKAIEQFSVRVKEKISQIDNLELTNLQWLELIRRFERQHIERLTRAFLFHHLAEIKNVHSIADILNDKKQPPRAAKREAPKDNSPIQAKRRKYKSANIDTSDNPLIASDDSSETLHSSLRSKNVRITSVTQKEDDFYTPGCTKIRPLLRHSVNKFHVNFFKPITPETDKVQIIQDKQYVKKIYPNLNITRHENNIHFQATLEKLEQRKGVSRGISQNQLAGASCQAVFAAYNSNVIIKPRGSKYHWFHIQGFFLGGQQSVTNLAPTTAAANYNTLEIVEEFIANKLVRDKVALVDIDVSLSYCDKSDIPANICFNLSWNEFDASFSEVININPRSHYRITTAMLHTFNFVREETQAQAQEELNQLPPKKLFS